MLPGEGSGKGRCHLDFIRIKLYEEKALKGSFFRSRGESATRRFLFKIKHRNKLLILFPGMCKQLSVVLLLFIFCLMAASCQERMVCPAYQSTYILDDSVRSYFFSRFESDSLPKRYGRVEKSNWGLVKHKSKSARLREIRTVAMKNVLPPKQESDSSLFPNRSLEELNRMREEVEEPVSKNN